MPQDFYAQDNAGAVHQFVANDSTEANIKLFSHGVITGQRLTLVDAPPPPPPPPAEPTKGEAKAAKKLAKSERKELKASAARAAELADVPRQLKAMNDRLNNFIDDSRIGKVIDRTR